MPKTSSQCLTCLLDDDGMKDTENVARASVDESDNVKIQNSESSPQTRSQA